MKNNTVLAKLIRGEVINLDNYSNPDALYDYIDYYEMNLYVQSSENKIAEKLKLLNQINTNNIERFGVEIKNICCCLESHNINYCVMVGIPFALRYHDEPLKRLQEDIDFFVSMEDFPKVKLIMEKLHYNVWNYSENKKHVTFINEGKTGNDTSRSGRCAVKFYRRLTDFQFYDIQFKDVNMYLDKYCDYKVMIPEMAFAHLLLHAHYYDMHPKILRDIYAIASSNCINYKVLNKIITDLKLERLFAIIMGILERIGLPKMDSIFYDDSVSYICDIISSETYWARVFTRLNKEELTLQRCFLYNATKYKDVYNRIIKDCMERRVSPMRKEFDI